MDNILKFLSDYAIDLSYEKLSKEVVHHVKRRTIDALGCALGGYHAEPSEIARAHALEVTANPGATLLGTTHRTAPELAAFANGVLVRYLDYNDTGLSKEPGHPSDNIPAVLAAAEYAGADLRTAITGVVLAYELQGRLGDAGPIRERGWDGVTYVAIAAAAGAGKSLGLNREQMANALALATIANIAMRQTRMGTLSMWKGCAAANACRNGVFASQMARRGLTGPQEAFEGPRGFLKCVTGPIKLPAFGGDGEPFEVELAKFKLYPTDYEAQCAIQPALELRQELGGRVEDIEKVLVDTYDLAVDIAADSPDKWAPTTRETADHSIPYILALALSNGSVWKDDFAEDRIGDPKLRALMQKIEVRRKKEYTDDCPESNWFHIEVVTRSGKHHIREVRYAKGHPKNPITDKEIEAKFRRLAEPLLPARRMGQVLDRLWHLEEVRSVREVFSLFEL